MISFFVPGRPRAKGSTRSFRHKTTSRIITLQQGAEKLRPWQRDIGTAARLAGCKPLSGPVEVAATFYVRRPKSHYTTAGDLRPTAPAFPTQRPDGDKMLRALFDGLTGVAFKDDSQVIGWPGGKRFADERGEGVAVKIVYPAATVGEFTEAA